MHSDLFTLLDSHAKHDHELVVLQSISVPKTLLQSSYKFQNFFFSPSMYDIIKGGIPCMGISPGRARTHINQSESKSTPINMLHSLIH